MATSRIPKLCRHRARNQGYVIQGILVRTPTGPVAYMVTEPSTNYYRNMTEQEPEMPALIGQVI